MRIQENQDMVYEKAGIGLENESTLHAAIKKWYSKPGDRFEAEVDGYIIDIVRGELLIEIQTRNFSAMSKKLHKLLKQHKVLLVHPIAKEKWIVKLDEGDNNIKSRRKSPKQGKLIDIFDELVRVPHIINEENFSLEVLMVSQEEIWKTDGKGSWRRKGQSIKDRRLLEVMECIRFNDKWDFLSFLPEALPQPFTNKLLAQSAGMTVGKATKLTYCLKKMGVIVQTGKQGNALLYEKLPKQNTTENIVAQ